MPTSDCAQAIMSRDGGDGGFASGCRDLRHCGVTTVDMGAFLRDTWRMFFRGGTLEPVIRAYALATCERLEWRMSEAARELGIDRRTLYRWAERWRVDPAVERLQLRRAVARGRK